MDNTIPGRNRSLEESNAQYTEEMRLSRASFESRASVQPQENDLEKPQAQKQNQLAQKKPQSPLQNSASESRMSLPHEIAFIALISCAQLLTQSGFAMSLPPEFVIGEHFGVKGSALLSWYSAAYSLTVGTFILPAGRLGDVYGHKKMFIIGWLCFSLFSLLAGLSAYVTPGTRGSIFFIVMRALQGVGPAILIPNAIAILGCTYKPGKRKNMAFALFGSTAPAGGATGLVFSALLTELAWWPWAFWILAISTSLMAILSVLVIPSIAADTYELSLVSTNDPSKSLWARLDILGTLTGVTGLVLINISWNQAPIVGWPTPYVYVLLIIGFLFMLIFVLIERSATHPLVPIRGLGKEVGFVLGCMVFGWASFGIWFFYLWQFLLVLRHESPLLLCAGFSPPVISGLCAAITTGLLLHKFGPGVLMLIAMVAFCTGNIILATMPVKQTYWAQTFVALVIMPWGMDMSFPSATIILSNSMPREHQGMAASLVTTVVNYSISLGLGFAGTVQSRVLAGGGTILQGYRSAWYLGIGLSGLGVVVAVAFNAVEFLGKKSEVRAEDEEEGEMSAG